MSFDYEYRTPAQFDNARTASQQPGQAANQVAAKVPLPDVQPKVNQSALDTANIDDAAGRRVRLRPKPDAVAQIYGPASSLMGKILTNTRGVVWPFQPAISYQQEVEYSTTDLVHSIQEFLTYKTTKAAKFTVSGSWSVQTQKEGLYALACIRFFQTVTKMYFGGMPGSNVEGLQGTPPPVLLFDAYGQNMFNCLPVIVNSFSVTLPQDVDYYPVDLSNLTTTFSNLSSEIAAVKLKNLSSSNNIAWLPVLFTIETNLVVQNTPQKLRQFDLDKFRTGQLIKQGGWI
jgi:hypothetical protein